MKITLFPEIAKPKDTFFTLLAGGVVVLFGAYVLLDAHIQRSADPTLSGRHFLGHGLMYFLACGLAHVFIVGAFIKHRTTTQQDKIGYPRLCQSNAVLLYLLLAVIMVADANIAFRMLSR